LEDRAHLIATESQQAVDKVNELIAYMTKRKSEGMLTMEMESPDPNWTPAQALQWVEQMWIKLRNKHLQCRQEADRSLFSASSYESCRCCQHDNSYKGHSQEKA